MAASGCQHVCCFGSASLRSLCCHPEPLPLWGFTTLGRALSGGGPLKGPSSLGLYDIRGVPFLGGPLQGDSTLFRGDKRGTPIFFGNAHRSVSIGSCPSLELTVLNRVYNRGVLESL